GRVAALNYDVSNVKGASSAIVELSHPNGFFEHYSGTYRDRNLSPHAYKHFALAALRGRIEIPAAQFPGAGYYQLRVAALAADGRLAGYVSDPVNMQVASSQISASRKIRRGAATANVN